MEILKALKTDFVKAAQRVCLGGPAGSKISFQMQETEYALDSGSPNRL
jgi:hypothetical protein